MNKRTRESKSLGINRGVVRPKPKETPRLARTVRELRSQHLQNVSDASNRDNVHNTSVISNNDISVSSDSTVDTHDISNNSRIMGNTADLPASLSVFPHTPATVSRPRSDQSTNDTVSLDISPLPARLLVSLGDTTTTAAAAKNDANPLDMNSDKPLTITSPFGCAFPRTPMAASTIATETNRTSNDSRTNMVTPVIQRNTLFASQLVPVSGNGYIASAEDTPATERSSHALHNDHLEQIPTMANALVTPCVRRTRRADNSKLFKGSLSDDIQPEDNTPIMENELATNVQPSQETVLLVDTPNKTIEHDKDLRVLVEDTQPSSPVLTHPPLSPMDDPVTCITDTPSEFIPITTTVNDSQRVNDDNDGDDDDVRQAIGNAMQITQPTQIIQPINLQLSADDHNSMTGTIPTLILSRTPSPIIKRYIPAYHRHMEKESEENALPKDAAFIEPVASSIQEDKGIPVPMEAAAPTDSQSFQFHTPVVDETSMAHTPQKSASTRENTLTFSAFLKQRKQQENRLDHTRSTEMLHSDPELPSHITIDDPMLIDRLIESDPVVETPRRMDKKRDRSVELSDKGGVAMQANSTLSSHKKLKGKQHHMSIQRDIGFDEVSDNQSSIESDMLYNNDDNNEEDRTAQHSNDKQQSIKRGNTTTLRRCEHCSTSVTTSWRKGPNGLPTLCNQCGSFYAMHKVLPEFRAVESPKQPLSLLPDYLPGDRVWAYSYYDGYYHSATVKGNNDYGTSYRVVFDDRRHHMTTDGAMKSKLELEAEHLKPLELEVDTDVWVMKMGQRELKEGRIGSVDLDEERCRVYWISGSTISTTLSPWISISRIALPATKTANVSVMADGQSAGKPDVSTVTEEDEEEKKEEEKKEEMDDQLPVEANTSAVQADITSPEFINSLLGPPPSQTNTDDDISSSSSNSESSALLNRLLFKNIVFVLTNIPSQSESNNIKSEDKLIQCTKEELTYLIQDYGGQVEPDISVSNVNAASDDVLNNHTTILICGEIKRTKKYFLALALDIPRISYRWIIDVTKSGRLDTILNYSLCNGFSKELNAFVASRPIPAITSSNGHSSQRLLSDLVIHLKGSTTFKSDWETVLTAAGATIVDHKQLRTIGCDYLVLEKRPTSTWINNLSDTVRSRIKAIVTSEWVAQCLINQRVVRWQQHPSYTQWS